MEQYENSAHGFMTTHRLGPTGSGSWTLDKICLAPWVLMPVSYTITHSVYAELMLRKVQKIESDGESRPQAGRTPFVYTYCVAFRSCRWGYSTAIQVSKRLHLTMGKGVVVNRTGIRL